MKRKWATMKSVVGTATANSVFLCREKEVESKTSNNTTKYAACNHCTSKIVANRMAFYLNFCKKMPSKTLSNRQLDRRAAKMVEGFDNFVREHSEDLDEASRTMLMKKMLYRSNYAADRGILRTAEDYAAENAMEGVRDCVDSVKYCALELHYKRPTS